MKTGISQMKPYKHPVLFFSSHIETIYPAIARSVETKPYTRERIKTPDADFLDLDWILQDSKKVVIVSHGLEGNSQRAYIKGIANIFSEDNYDVLAWNYRGCSEEMNLQKRFYHSGATDDLDLIVKHALAKGYTEIILIGFSLGGNLTLKYLGEQKVDASIKTGIAFSVPMHLHSSCQKISEPANFIYANRFLKSLKKKIVEKARVRNDIDISPLQTIKTLQDFDDHYTSQLHGYRDAIDYYTKCSSIGFVENIQVPTLIVNALNDPFLSKQCFPINLLKNHPFVKFETTTRGGHVGFTQFNKKNVFWSEERALHFAKHHV